MKILAFACLLSGASFALEMRETKYPDGTTRTVHYVNRETGADLKEGRELEYHKNGKLKREAFWRNNLKHGLEKTFDEEGIMVSSAKWAEGRLVERVETFESENEYGVGRRALVLFNPLPLLMAGVVGDKDLAIPAGLVEFGYHLGGYYAAQGGPHSDHQWRGRLGRRRRRGHLGSARILDRQHVRTQVRLLRHLQVR